jgi:hypothetical protein
LVNTFFYNRPQYVSYAASFVVTCLLFTAVIYNFRPGLMKELRGQVSVIWTPYEEITIPPPAFDTVASVQSSRALSELAKAQAQLTTAEQDLFLVADVSSNGRADFIQVVDSPVNDKLERRVVNVLKKASFKPATKDGRPVNSRLFLLIQTIDVRG